MVGNDRWRRLIEYARWAPSPHNVQSWLFKIESEDRATLMFDPDRLLPGTDPTGRFCTAGFGIMLEMLGIAAAGETTPLQLNTQYLGVALDFNKKGPQPYANLTLTPRLSSQPEPLDCKLILERRTSRLPYDDHPVDQAVLSELAAIAKSYGHCLEFSSDPKQVSWIVRLNSDTMFYDMSEPVARKEVGGLIRFSRKEANRKADGLAAYAMRFPGALMKLFVKQNWLFRLPGVYHATRAMYERSMRGTRTVAWLSGPYATPTEWDQAGRMLARLWLTMTKHGVYLHPFGSVITNERSHQRMVDHFANAERDNDLWLLVRLGHSDIPPQACRLTVDQLLLK